VALFAVGLVVLFCESSSGQRIHTESANKVLRMPFLIKGIHTSSCDGFSAATTARSSLLVVVSFAIGLVGMLKEGSREGFSAICTHKVLRMPLLSQSINGISFDWLMASSTFWSEKGKEVSFTVWSSVFFKKVSSREGFQALTTDEVVRMPLLTQGSNATIHYSSIAVSAFWAEHELEAVLAVRKPILFEEVLSSDWLVAVSAGEVLWMVATSKSLHHFSKNGTFASSALSS